MKGAHFQPPPPRSKHLDTQIFMQTHLRALRMCVCVRVRVCDMQTETVIVFLSCHHQVSQRRRLSPSHCESLVNLDVWKPLYPICIATLLATQLHTHTHRWYVALVYVHVCVFCSVDISLWHTQTHTRMVLTVTLTAKLENAKTNVKRRRWREGVGLQPGLMSKALDKQTGISRVCFCDVWCLTMGYVPKLPHYTTHVIFWAWKCAEDMKIWYFFLKTVQKIEPETIDTSHPQPTP